MTETARAALIVYLQALVWVFAGRSLYVPLVAAMLASLPLLFARRPPGHRLARSCVLAALGLAALAASTCFVPNTPEADRVLPIRMTRFLADSLLVAQSLLVACGSAGHVRTRYLPILCVLTLFGAFHQPYAASQRTIYLALAMAASLSFGLLMSQHAEPRWVGRVNAAALRRRLIAGVLATTLPVTAILAWSWEEGVRRSHALLPGWLALAAGHAPASRGYVRSGSLRSITAEQLSDPMRVALRVYADRPPGYVRGRVFDAYRDSQWHLGSQRRGKWHRLEDKDIRRALTRTPRGLPQPEPGQSLFALDPQIKGPLVEMEIHNDPRRDAMFFLPLATSFVRGAGSQLVIDEHRALHGGIEASVPYAAYVGREWRQRELSGEQRRRLLAPLEGIHPDVFSLANDLGHSLPTSRQKIDAVTAFLRTSFAYADAGMSVPRGAEPLSYFLLNRVPAHCEYFASAAVALLRALGVPARYVTGYVVTELEREYGDYWLARNRNAHAWAEAYDESRQRWVLVEATPGMTAPRDDDALADNPLGTPLETQSAQRTADPRGAWFARVWSDLLAVVFARPFVWALVACSLALLPILVIWPVRWRGSRPVRSDRRELAHLRRWLTQLDRRARRRRFVRRPHETLHQFAERLHEFAAADAVLAECAREYIAYANRRYGGEAGQGWLLSAHSSKIEPVNAWNAANVSRGSPS